MMKDNMAGCSVIGRKGERQPQPKPFQVLKLFFLRCLTYSARFKSPFGRFKRGIIFPGCQNIDTKYQNISLGVKECVVDARRQN